MRLAYDIVAHHYHNFNNHMSTELLRMVITGTAGTGKSYLISALAELLGHQCILTGTTEDSCLVLCQGFEGTWRKEHGGTWRNNHMSTELLRMVITGTAGTGKSYLISALAELLGHQCILTGFTEDSCLVLCQ